MKLNTLFVAAICASTLLNSCVFKTAQENQLQITHTSLVDGDAFAIIQLVNVTAVEGVKYAEYTESTGEAKEAAAKVKGFYTQFLPQLDSIASEFNVTLSPVPVYSDHQADTTVADTVASSHKQFDYAHHAQEELTLVKAQLKRLTKNTNEALQIFAKAQLAKAEEVYTQIGGKEEPHAHH